MSTKTLTPPSEINFPNRTFKIFLSYYSLIVGLLLAPPIFNHMFSMVQLLEREKPGLWLLSVFLIALALFIRFGRWKGITFFFLVFNGLLMISIELGSRTIINLWPSPRSIEFARRGNISYNDFQTYLGHPFLQFTGRPFIPDTEKQIFEKRKNINNFGFNGDRDFIYEKPLNVIRIATIGGSTTANEYPKLMEEFLNKNSTSSQNQFEVLNFGTPFWTTAHSLVNFVLNVVDFQPDYAVIHHAWNDAKVRRATSLYRGDYAHALKVFEPPSSLVDRYLLRVSVIYRFIRFRVGRPAWTFIENSTLLFPTENTDLTNSDAPGAYRRTLEELKPYRRNLETIIDLATLRGIGIVLTTMPHSTDPQKKWFSATKHIDQCNEIIRDIARKYGEKILFVDLDQLMTGQMEEVFRDVAHVTNTGRAFKAHQIGHAILKDFTNSSI